MSLARAQNHIFELDPVLGLYFSLEPLPVGVNLEQRPGLA